MRHRISLVDGPQAAYKPAHVRLSLARSTLKPAGRGQTSLQSEGGFVDSDLQGRHQAYGNRRTTSSTRLVRLCRTLTNPHRRNWSPEAARIRTIDDAGTCCRCKTVARQSRLAPGDAARKISITQPPGVYTRHVEALERDILDMLNERLPPPLRSQPLPAAGGYGHRPITALAARTLRRCRRTELLRRSAVPHCSRWTPRQRYALSHWLSDYAMHAAQARNVAQSAPETGRLPWTPESNVTESARFPCYCV